jgi:hypothetical protein
MKGQFMLISSIVAGLVVISVASAISDVNRQEYNNPETSYQLEMIKEEASKAPNNNKGRENFEKLVSFLPGATRTNYWGKNACFNVTITSTDERFRLNCIS